MSSLITGKVQDITGGTSARTVRFQSWSDPSFDVGNVTLNTEKDIVSGADGTFSISLHPGTYRVVVDDVNYKRSTWFITVPADGNAHTIDSIRVTESPPNPSSYYTAAQINTLLAAIVISTGISRGPADPIDPPGAGQIIYVNYTNGTIWINDNVGHWKYFG